jgi:hypothetical protein
VTAWICLGGPLHGLRAEVDGELVTLTDGSRYRVRQFVDGGAALVHEEDDGVIIGRAPAPGDLEKVHAMLAQVGRLPSQPLTAGCVVCGDELMFSSRQRGDGRCGPHSRERAVHISVIRAFARRVRIHDPHLRTWSGTAGYLAKLGIGGPQVELAIRYLGEVDCQLAFDAYMAGDPCAEPCGDAACGPAGGACKKGPPR